MSNLIVVSNREPYEHNSVDGDVVCQHTDGGLVSALDPVMKCIGGTWVAWGSGGADREVPGQVNGLPVPPDSPAYRLRRVWLDSAVVREVSRAMPTKYCGHSVMSHWIACFTGRRSGPATRR